MATTKGRASSAKSKGKEKEQEQKQSVLEQTYGSFTFIGEVVGIGKDNATNEGTSEKNGAEWKSLRFGIKTSPDNVNYVELFGMEKDEFTIKNAKTGEKDKIPFEDRFDEDAIPQGWYMLGTNMTLEQIETGKKNKDGSPKTKGHRVVMQEIDAIDYILENLGDGETVYVSGNIQYSIYKNEETGEEREQKRYQISFISKQKEDVDFEDEEFEETSMFKQTIVIDGTEKDDKDKNKVYVYARIIGYKNSVAPATFTVMEEGQTKKLAAKLRSFKFGTQLEVSGIVMNRYEEVEVEEDKDDWGGAKPTGYRGGTTNNKVVEMRITFADASTLKEKKYKEEDFINEAGETYGDKDDEDFGKKPSSGRSKKNKSEDDDDDDEGLDIDEDDLPF